MERDDDELIEAIGPLPAMVRLITFPAGDAAAAFVAAISRTFARDRRMSGTDATVSVLGGSAGRGVTLALDGNACAMAREHFSPLPVSAVIPYAVGACPARVVLDAISTEMRGLESARALLGTR